MPRSNTPFPLRTLLASSNVNAFKLASASDVGIETSQWHRLARGAACAFQVAIHQLIRRSVPLFMRAVLWLLAAQIYSDVDTSAAAAHRAFPCVGEAHLRGVQLEGDEPVWDAVPVDMRKRRAEDVLWRCRSGVVQDGGDGGCLGRVLRGRDGLRGAWRVTAARLNTEGGIAEGVICGSQGCVTGM